MNDGSDIVAAALYGTLAPNDQKDAIDPDKKHTRRSRECRKVIFATSIAETSLTVQGIVYVVDCGYVKSQITDLRTGASALKVVQISQAAAIQRAGRCGRTRSGECWRIYTEKTATLLWSSSHRPAS